MKVGRLAIEKEKKNTIFCKKIYFWWRKIPKRYKKISWLNN